MAQIDVSDLTAQMRAEAARRPAQGAEYAIFAGMVAAIVRPGRYGQWANASDPERIAAIDDALRALDEATDERCPSCGEPWRLLRSGAVGHCGDEHGNDCPEENR